MERSIEGRRKEKMLILKIKKSNKKQKNRD